MLATDTHATPAASTRTRTRAGHWLRRAAIGARLFAMFALSVLVLPYVVVPMYATHEPTPFAGATLFNPYAASGPRWQRANFHAHSRAWGGLTSGRQAPAEVRGAYRALGYDVIGLSNYHQIARVAGDSNFVPVYEHGFSIRKTHQLVIGAREIVGMDFPLWQTTSARQYLLHRLRDTAALTAIVHPYMRLGYDTTELATLGGFDLLEVRSHWNDASAWWDAVLTAGNPVWAIGNDDSHDVTRPKEIGVVWTMVNAPTARANDIIAAMRRGNMYVVSVAPGTIAPQLESQILLGDTLVVRFTQPMQQIRVISDSGAVRAETKGLAEIRHPIASSDHYARVVGTTASATIYLNPVVRVDGTPAPWAAASTRPLASAVSRTAAALLWLCGVVLLWPGRVASRLRAALRSVRTPRPVAAGAMLLALAVSTALPSTALAQPTRESTAPLPFRSGEYHEYDLKFGVISVGSGSLSVSAPERLRGREVLRLRYEINGGIPLFRVRDVMESWFDTTSMLSLRFTQDLHEGSKRYNRHFDFYPDELIVLERGKDRAPTVAQPLDDAAFIYFVRAQKLEVGQTLSFNRYFRPNANPVTIQVLRRETITVPAGTFSTIVVRPIIRTSGIFSEGGQAELWFSDDSAHTLIQMKAKLSFGSINLYLRPSRNRR